MTRLADRIGQPLGTSRWTQIDQPRINAFADVTEDHQFIHIDPLRAAENGLNGTVAHGFLTLSLLSTLAYDVMPALGPYDSSINYGFNRVRFLAPVPVGARLRAHFTLAEVTEKAPDRLLIRLDTTLEIHGTETPAVVADWLILLNL
jgi:acyl dehydratase